MKLGFRGAAGIGVEWEAMTLLACLVSLWGLNHRDSSFCAQASSETHRSESVFMCKELKLRDFKNQPQLTEQTQNLRTGAGGCNAISCIQTLENFRVQVSTETFTHRKGSEDR